MRYLILLLNEHRQLFVWVLALSIWVAAYGLYFRHMVRRWIGRGQKHSWSIDMATKKVVSRGKEEVY